MWVAYLLLLLLRQIPEHAVVQFLVFLHSRPQRLGVPVDPIKFVRHLCGAIVSGEQHLGRACLCGFGMSSRQHITLAYTPGLTFIPTLTSGSCPMALKCFSMVSSSLSKSM